MKKICAVFLLCFLLLGKDTPGTCQTPGVPVPLVNPPTIGCALCMQPPPNNPKDKLTLLLVNSSQAVHIALAGEQTVLFGRAGSAKRGCTVSDYKIGWRQGVFEATVTVSSDHQLDKAILESRYCASCRAAVLEASPSCDLLLFNHQDRRLYPLYGVAYDFYIGGYHITTKPQGMEMGLRIAGPTGSF